MSERAVPIARVDVHADRADQRARLFSPDREVKPLLVGRDHLAAWVERAVGPVVQALLGPSSRGREVAREAIAFLRGSRTLGPMLIDALLDARREVDASMIASASFAADVRLDVALRARLASVLEDRALGRSALAILAPYVADDTAEAELPLAARLLPIIARDCTRSSNEGAWRSWIACCGRDRLATALVPVIRASLASGATSEDQLHHMALLGRALAPIAPDLLPYLDPATARSARHVHLAVRLAESLASEVTVPALIALLATGHQYEALLALAAIGPAAAPAVPRSNSFAT